MTKHIACCSGGKDSVATLILAKIHDEPLDEVVYSEIMFDKDLSAEHPEHRDFIYNKLKPWVEKELGVPFTIVHGDRTVWELFHTPVVRGPHKGTLRAFPPPGRCYINRDCKARPMIRYWKNREEKEVVQYLGIATDEPKRLAKLDTYEGTPKISLLSKYGYTEADAMKLCEDWRLLSPIYSFAKRNGCWFCANCKDKEWLRLMRVHPELFDRLIEAEIGIKNPYRRCLTRTETPSELKKRLIDSLGGDVRESGNQSTKQNHCSPLSERLRCS